MLIKCLSTETHIIPICAQVPWHQHSLKDWQMYTHMEYLQRCFHKATDWNEDNKFNNITATSQALLDFPIPNGARLEVLSRATEHLALSLTLLNYQSINGSLAYMYTSVPLKNSTGTKDVSLQDAIAGFRIIEPYHQITKQSRKPRNDKASLVYGRMYFPGSALEAMIIKKISKQTQLLIKCINNPHLKRNGTMIVYLQKNAPRFSQEYIYSTNEALFGFRCLYNFGNDRPATPPLIPKFDNSVVSVGAEFWYAAMSMSPGLSTALRYSTRSTSTGKPLTMTISCNPILGHISSTYNVKTSVASTVCSKYDFNWYSYASNLSIGFELYNFSKPSTIKSNHLRRSDPSIHHENLAPLIHEHQLENSTRDPHHNKIDHTRILNPIPGQHSRSADLYSPLRLRTEQDIKNQTVMTAFQSLVSESNFSSVLKASVSLSDRMLKLLWVGRYKEFLVSSGVKIGVDPVKNVPELGKFGVSFSYAS